VESESRSRKDFQPEELVQQKMFNDSDSGLTFCSPIVTVLTTNVQKHHTWQFKDVNVSTKDDRGSSERLHRTNLHTYTQERLQVRSVTRAHHATLLTTCNRSWQWRIHTRRLDEQSNKGAPNSFQLFKYPSFSATIFGYHTKVVTFSRPRKWLFWLVQLCDSSGNHHS